MREPIFELHTVVSELAAARQTWRSAQQRYSEAGGRELPAREALADIMQGLRGVLFPMRLGPTNLRQENEDFYVGHTLGTVLHALHAQVRLELRYNARRNDAANNSALDTNAGQIVRGFAQTLPAIRRLLDSDVIAAFEGDPAARSVDEVLLCYPGILAMVYHRVAHAFYQAGVPLLARIVAELAHAQTGIDIHPGASIGAGFFRQADQRRTTPPDPGRRGSYLCRRYRAGPHHDRSRRLHRRQCLANARRGTRQPHHAGLSTPGRESRLTPRPFLTHWRSHDRHPIRPTGAQRQRRTATRQRD